MSWLAAVKEYASKTGKWQVPKRGTPEYDAIKAIQERMLKETAPPAPVPEAPAKKSRKALPVVAEVAEVAEVAKVAEVAEAPKPKAPRKKKVKAEVVEGKPVAEAILEATVAKVEKPKPAPRVIPDVVKATERRKTKSDVPASKKHVAVASRVVKEKTISFE